MYIRDTLSQFKMCSKQNSFTLEFNIFKRLLPHNTFEISGRRFRMRGNLPQQPFDSIIYLYIIDKSTNCVVYFLPKLFSIFFNHFFIFFLTPLFLFSFFNPFSFHLSIFIILQLDFGFSWIFLFRYLKHVIPHVQLFSGVISYRGDIGAKVLHKFIKIWIEDSSFDWRLLR